MKKAAIYHIKYDYRQLDITSCYLREIVFLCSLANPGFLLSGICFKVPQPDLVYLLEFYYQLMVTILSEWNVSQHNFLLRYYLFFFSFFFSFSFSFFCFFVLFFFLYLFISFDQTKIFCHNIVQMCQNGMLIRCPGLFAGELIV
jgi:hypothetical protein